MKSPDVGPGGVLGEREGDSNLYNERILPSAGALRISDGGNVNKP